MIEVTILARNWGDKSRQMTVQQFQEEFPKMEEKGNWAIFAEDTAVPKEQRVAEKIDNLSQIKDGMALTLVPQLAGGISR